MRTRCVASTSQRNEAHTGWVNFLFVKDNLLQKRLLVMLFLVDWLITKIVVHLDGLIFEVGQSCGD